MSDRLVSLAIGIAERLIIDFIFKGVGDTNHNYVNLSVVEKCIERGTNSRISKRIFKNQQQIDTVEHNLKLVPLNNRHHLAIEYFRTSANLRSQQKFAQPSELFEMDRNNKEGARPQDVDIALEILQIAIEL